ncbi:DUF5343 domain-containing protein [Sphingobacterium sp. UGAL515B_05]|uniref:DUF5343 domain-containing protein n=1 Tax=Sphingobacterium sp. UGAL515B_05 TaxID=2986767 RepID=UPI002954CCE8|nr:DUF5343 domain-containing protein [Sphingobacterium sp. UGAL515B_05]WON93648.1 DUF5343 domain-containing protein [Sphingobacterium sp. UGAL515B_05]
MNRELPYMSSPGSLPKILNKIIEASVPESFNADFLGTKLGFPGGNQRSFISWAKKCTLLNQDGTIPQLYKNFRNPDTRGSAMAKALRVGYEELYARNEYAHDLPEKDLKKLITEITGKPHDNSTVSAILRSFSNAKEFANFESKTSESEYNSTNRNEIINEYDTQKVDLEPKQVSKLNLGLNYTINLVLPKTDDPSIYDAIFKSLKNNLLNE